jgi:hypothetical protein
MSQMGLGRVKTKSDLVLMPSGRQILRFFALRMTVKPKISGAVIPPRVFTPPGSLGDIQLPFASRRLPTAVKIRADTAPLAATG